MALVEQGGDQLLFTESQYIIPLEHVQIPLLGPPTLTFRHVLGAAGVTRLPTLVQNLGVRVGVSLLRFDYVIDPSSHESRFDISLALVR